MVLRWPGEAFRGTRARAGGSDPPARRRGVPGTRRGPARSLPPRVEARCSAPHEAASPSWPRGPSWAPVGLSELNAAQFDCPQECPQSVDPIARVAAGPHSRTTSTRRRRPRIRGACGAAPEMPKSRGGATGARRGWGNDAFRTRCSGASHRRPCTGGLWRTSHRAVHWLGLRRPCACVDEPAGRPRLPSPGQEARALEDGGGATQTREVHVSDGGDVEQ
jgi:hypothetical protein